MQPSYQSGFYAPGRGVAKHPELWRGCVGAWNPGLGNTGLSLRDWSGNQNNGTLIGGPTWGVSDGRQALSFDGVDDYVAATPGLDFSGDFSISMYIKGSTISGVQALISKNLNLQNNAFVLFLSSGKLGCVTKLSNSQSVSTEHPTVFSVGVWYHVAMIMDSNTVTLYVNGLTPTATVMGNRNNLGVFRIGETNTPFWGSLTGLVDTTLLYNRALTQQEIQLLAQRPGIAYELARRKTYFIQAATSTSQFYDVLSPLIFAGTN
jgi:hypothetical protein